jgi:hypothetical protein
MGARLECSVCERLFHPLCLREPVVSEEEILEGAEGRWACPCCGEDNKVRVALLVICSIVCVGRGAVPSCPLPPCLAGALARSQELGSAQCCQDSRAMKAHWQSNLII